MLFKADPSSVVQMCPEEGWKAAFYAEHKSSIPDAIGIFFSLRPAFRIKKDSREQGFE